MSGDPADDRIVAAAAAGAAEVLVSGDTKHLLPLGTVAPPFSLPDVSSGKPVNLQDYASAKGLLVMFICRNCPYVKHVQDELARIGRDYTGSDLAIVAISSNDAAAYPDDAPESLREQARELGFTFPSCFPLDRNPPRSAFRPPQVRVPRVLPSFCDFRASLRPIH